VSLCARLPWLVAQREERLLFYSWPVAPDRLSGRLPPGLELDLFEGQAWITLIPFQMRGLRARLTPPLPGVSAFGEVDCLTYVRRPDGSAPGIWFFRITADTRLGAFVARHLWGLPYVAAPVELRQDAGWTRCVAGAPDAPVLDLRYRGRGEPFETSPGTLAHFVVERLVMYSRTGRGTLLAGREARAPRQVQVAEVAVERNLIPELAEIPWPHGEAPAWTCAVSDIRTWLPAPAGITTTRGR
jgi:uncharacterized protein